MSKNIQRRESTRTIKKPKNDTDLFSEKEKRLKLNDNMKGCLNIIKELLSRKHADYCWHFHEPVNIKIVSDYLSVIERPMDFTTILKKINNGEYSSPRLFVDDVRLVFTNCYRYNDEDSILVNSAQKSQRVFEYRLSRVPNLSDFLSITPSCINSTSEDQLTFDSNKLIELQQDVQNINNKISKMIDEKSGNNTYRIINGNLATNGTKLSVSKRVRQNSISNTIKKPKLSNIETNKITTNKTPKSATVEPISDILINGQSKVITSEINPKKMCPSFSDVDSVHNYEDDDDDENDDCSIMTYDQKRQLSLDINKLPANHLGEIVEILQHNDERLREDHPEEIEIDFETLQSKTLKQLQKYVADFYKKKNKPYKLPKQNVSSREEAQQLKKIELERRLDEVNSKLFYSGNKKFFKKPHKSNELNLSEDSDSSECSDKVDNDVKCNTNSDEPEKLFKDKTVPDQDPRDKATLLRIEQKRKENAELLENRRVIFEAERAQILAEAAKKDLPLKAKSEQEHSNEEILAARDKLRKEKLEIRKNMMSNQNSKMDLTQQGELMASFEDGL
ncbi:hypothetical protein A3Q56_08094 [Intoshia linei]|uniref:Bromodomain testis-specific protein n=1 Tax=Intoshia linei TaxID=1819745 RepID=A0A177AQV9_9BILA|nr:hypothetical protein A3Q56_08094 [Intoshia linei]